MIPEANLIRFEYPFLEGCRIDTSWILVRRYQYRRVDHADVTQYSGSYSGLLPGGLVSAGLSLVRPYAVMTVLMYYGRDNNLLVDPSRNLVNRSPLTAHPDGSP